MLNEDQQEKIVKHYMKYFDVKQKDLFYFPEKENNGKKIDLFWAKPNKKHPFNTLATMGLSDFVIRGVAHRHIELLMILPAEWNPSFAEFENTWQAKFLRKVASSVPDQKMTIEYGAIFVDGEDEPISPDCNMYAGLVVLPEVYKPKIFLLKDHGKEINFFALTTLTKPELDKACSKDIFEFIDEDLVTENGTDIFVYNDRAPRKTASEKHEEIKQKKEKNKKETEEKTENKVVTKKK